jgi:hypothetical protein
MIRKLTFLVALVLMGAFLVAQTSQSYSFLRDKESRPIFGAGTRPTVTAEMGVPPGTPFFDTSTFLLYYWSGSAWTASGISGEPGAASSIFSSSAGRLTFEGATADTYETEFTATDPTADRLITIPNATGTMVIENAFNYNIPDNGNGGTAATYTLEPAGYSLATLSCADANGCTVTMGETGVVAGASIVVIQIVAGSGNITIVDDDGTTAELDGDANLTLNALDSVTLHYAAVGNWIETAYIDIS